MNRSAIRLKLTQHCKSSIVQNETFLNKVKQKRKKEKTFSILTPSFYKCRHSGPERGVNRTQVTQHVSKRARTRTVLQLPELRLH